MTSDMWVVLFLVVFGIAAIVLGAFAWLKADELVRGAREQLSQMFGQQMPQLFTTEPDPRGARIAGVGFAIVGAVFLIAAAVIALRAVVF